jgi:hypothetical protein
VGHLTRVGLNPADKGVIVLGDEQQLHENVPVAGLGSQPARDNR